MLAWKDVTMDCLGAPSSAWSSQFGNRVRPCCRFGK